MGARVSREAASLARARHTRTRYRLCEAGTPSRGTPRAVAKELDRLLARVLRDDGFQATQISATPLPRNGTVLVREWGGVTHHVTVVADGFLWNGKTYPSLSSVARTITGTNWNGPRFFGMRELKRKAPEANHGG